MSALEIWRPVSTHEGYEVSSLGRVRSTKRAEERILAPIMRKGKRTYTLCQHGHATYVHAATLVAREFGEVVSEKQEVLDDAKKRLDDLLRDLRAKEAEAAELTAVNAARPARLQSDDRRSDLWRSGGRGRSAG